MLRNITGGLSLLLIVSSIFLGHGGGLMDGSTTKNPSTAAARARREGRCSAGTLI
jgi:hypothetical protein